VLRESLSDLFEVDHYLEDDPALNYSAPGVGPDVMKKMRKGHWPVQDELDLHGMNRDQARDALGAFLTKAQQRNHRCVCVIHGRGFGSRGQEPVLKSMVHSWLVQKAWSPSARPATTKAAKAPSSFYSAPPSSHNATNSPTRSRTGMLTYAHCKLAYALT
jgi:DNA-nicking Smr family endonuclease